MSGYGGYGGGGGGGYGGYGGYGGGGGYYGSGGGYYYPSPFGVYYFPPGSYDPGSSVDQDASYTPSSTVDSTDAATFGNENPNDIVVTGHRYSGGTSYTQLYLQDVSYQGAGVGGDGGGGEPQLNPTVEKVISKGAEALKIIAEHMPDGKPKKAVEKLADVLDVVDQAITAQKITAEGAKALISAAINDELNGLSAFEFSATIAAITGAIGAESGPLDLFAASAAAAGALYIYYSTPTSEIADILADGIVNGAANVANLLH